MGVSVSLTLLAVVDIRLLPFGSHGLGRRFSGGDAGCP